MLNKSKDLAYENNNELNKQGVTFNVICAKHMAFLLKLYAITGTSYVKTASYFIKLDYRQIFVYISY